MPIKPVMVSPSHSPLLERPDAHSSSYPMEPFSISDSESQYHLVTKPKSSLLNVKMSTICKGLIFCLIFAAAVQLAFQMGISHASDVSCGGISYSKLFMDLSTAREELNTAQVANAQYKQEIAKCTDRDDTQTEAGSQLIDDRIRELEQSLDHAYSDIKQQAKHIEYLEKMLRTQNLKELAAVAGVENNEVVQQMPDADVNESIGTDTDTVVEELRLELERERKHKEEAQAHVAKLQQELSKERTLAVEEKENAVADALEQTRSIIQLQNTRMADAYAHFVDLLSHLTSEELDDGLSGAMKSGDLDKVMTAISRGYEQQESTPAHNMAVRLSHWLSVARRGDHGQNPLEYYKAQGVFSLDLLARNGFSFAQEESIIEYNTAPLGVVEYIANGKSYSVCPLSEYFDVMFHAVRRNGVSRFTTAQPLLRKLKSNKNIDNLILRIDTRDSIVGVIDDMPSFFEVLKRGGWFIIQLSSASNDKSELEAQIRSHLDSIAHKYTWECIDHHDNDIECVASGKTKQQ